ncbi:sulfatase family protein [Rubinisphaera margarita]|uniref:sulfatase family protein n=1 Tax=Rubinisphaera margarita TaxID=2909586 RepID=UPI001EE8252D|nr:sulfatase [Rubinisphaera margarita]MCG6155294.1 sulfatase [Rubinisphaera margarita]
MRRTVLNAMFLTVIGLLGAFPVLGAEVAGRPNIVFLMSDDQCCYSLGCYGNADVETPKIDQLAADGLVFDNHYDTTAICMASRANVMTGMLEYKTGCNFEHGPLTQEKWEKSYPMLLRAAGYQTAFAGKFGFEVVDSPTSKDRRLPEGDFDRWGGGPGQTFYETRKNKSMVEYADEYPHSTLSYGAFGRDFVRDAAAEDRPFCLSISFKAPHKPATPDPKFNAIYEGQVFQKPDNYGREHGLHFSEQSRRGRQYERFHSWNYSDRYDEVMAVYHQQVYAIDVAVGMIREAIEQAGVRDNTVIIFTSDNGFLCGSHGYGSKVLPYEESSRVPLIIYDPRHRNSGRQLRTDALTGNIDFAPTMCALAGIECPAEMDGRNLMAVYDNPQATIHESLPLINVWGPAAVHSLAVVTRDWKYIFWPHAADGMSPTEELYNTAEDPLELTNLAKDSQSRSQLQEMRALYDEEVRRWRENAVDYNDYEKYGVIFDRAVSWSEKATLLKNSRRRE